MAVDPTLLELLRCPQSGGVLRHVDDGSEYGGLFCADSGLLYPIGAANIPILLINEATRPSPQDVKRYED